MTLKYNIICTEKYLLIVDDSQITEGDYCLANAKTYNNEIVTYRKSPCPPPFVSNLNILKKIIAHLPLNGSPMLEGADLLPPLPDEAEEWARSQWSCEPGDYEELYYDGLEKGYNAAKEKYKYTEEDLVRAFNIGVNSQFESTELKLNKDESFDRHSKNLLRLIQSLQQPKMPIGFECEMEWENSKGEKGSSFTNVALYEENIKDYDAQLVLKTTINTGLTQWAGKWIY